MNDLALTAAKINTEDVLYSSIENGIALIEGSNAFSRKVTKFKKAKSKSFNQIRDLFYVQMKDIAANLITIMKKMVILQL